MKRIILTLLIGISATAAVAQHSVEFAYSIGFGTGDLGDFISKPSFRGITVDYRHMFNSNMAVGFNAGWNTFYAEESSKTYTLENQSLTGKQYRYSNHLPMLVTYTYFLSPDEFISPYAAFGLGTMYARRNTDMNLYTLEQEGWPFVLQPEIGIHFKTSDGLGTVVNLKYLHGFEAGDFNAAQSYLTLNIGFSFN